MNGPRPETAQQRQDRFEKETVEGVTSELRRRGRTGPLGVTPIIGGLISEPAPQQADLRQPRQPSTKEAPAGAPGRRKRR